MAEEIDQLKQRVLRTHLDDLKQSGAYSLPAADRGYLDENNEATPLGSEFLTLTDAGLMTDAGELTEEGQVYALNHRDSLHASPAIYRKREERGLNQLDKDAEGEQGGFWSMLGDFATESVPRMLETAYNAERPLLNILTAIPRKIYEKATGDDISFPATKTDDEIVNSIAETVTGGVLSSEPLASGAVEWLERGAALAQGKEDEYWQARQAGDLHRAEVAEIRGADMMEFLTGIDQWQQARAALVEKHGEDAVRKDEEFDRLAGNFILDPSNIVSAGVGGAVKNGVAATGRATLWAERTAMTMKSLQMEHAGVVASRAMKEAAVIKAQSVAEGVAERAAALRSVGNEAQALRYEATAARVQEKIAGITPDLESLVAREAELAGDITGLSKQAGVAEKITGFNAKVAAVRQAPAKVFGEVSERVGTGLVKTDEFLADIAERTGLAAVQQSYGALRSLPVRVLSISAGPVGTAVGTASQIMSSGPLLQSIGNFSKVLGKELIMERGSIPFWRRVANNSSISKTQRFLAHRADEMTLGGRLTEVTTPAIRGAVKSYPMNLAFEVIQNPNQDLESAMQNAVGPSLVFGGGFAGAGAMFQGDKARMKSMRINDEINFSRTLRDSQKPGFSGMHRGARRVISTYAGAFPNLNWEFKPDGPSHYDPVTNTVRINPTSNNPLRALISHEVLHYATIRNQMQSVVHSMLLGDNITPGVVRDVSDRAATTETFDPTISTTRMRRLDTPERKRAHEILNSGEFPGLSALFHSSDKITPRNPAIALIKKRQKNGARLTNAERKILREDAAYDGVAQALAHSTGKYGKIAREALSLVMAPHGRGLAPDVMAGRIRRDMTASEMWLQVSTELKQIEKLKDRENDKRNDNREWSDRDIKSHLANKPKETAIPDSDPANNKQMAQEQDFAEANNPELGGSPLAAEEMSKGQKVTIDGEPLEVVEVVKSRDSMGNEEVDHVVLQDGARFGRQILEGGDVIYQERPASESNGNYFPENGPRTPGLLRSLDGTLDPDFQRFKDAYDSRMEAAGLPKASLEKIAEEFFNENTVDHLMEMVESGEFSKMAGRTQAGRHMRAFIEATIPRVPILRDFFFRTGGVMEAGGRHVMGNGLLAEGIRELPEARAMMRKMVRDSAGEAAYANKLAKSKDGAGAPITVERGDPIIDSFHAVLETDANGNPVKDKNGDHIALSRATDEARSSAGHVITETMVNKVNNGYLPAKGEIAALDSGGWFGESIPKEAIDALSAKGILNSKQIAILRNINTATKGGQGTRFLLTNHPATIKGRGGKVKYATLGATLRETVPVGIGVTKDGNILVHLLNVEQFNRNITTRAASKTGKRLYDGNTEVIKQDAAAMMDAHAANTKTDKFYQDKYGAAWKDHQNFINTLFGEMTKGQRDYNPMLQADAVGSNMNVYRSYRLDRISKATKMDGTPIPFGYSHVKVNYLPDGVVDPKGGAAKTPAMKIHEETGLPLNPDGTVTVYHGTTQAGSDAIKKTGVIRSAAEPDVYFTTEPTSDGTGYGDGSVVAVRIDPRKLILDDEFPDGRKDFRVEVGKSKSLSVKLEPSTPTP